MAVRFDFKDFDRVARSFALAADQIPFALSRSLNDGLTEARTQIVEKTWPGHVNVRNARFMAVALRRQFASKRRLSAALYDNLGRGNLVLHEDGGIRQARDHAIAIPSTALLGKRTGKGVPKGSRPRALPNAFVADGTGRTAHLKAGAIYQRKAAVKKGRSRKVADNGASDSDVGTVQLMYTLKPSVSMKPQVPFHKDFDAVMSRAVWRSFVPRLQAAMAGRRK